MDTARSRPLSSDCRSRRKVVCLRDEAKYTLTGIAMVCESKSARRSFTVTDLRRWTYHTRRICRLGLPCPEGKPKSDVCTVRQRSISKAGMVLCKDGGINLQAESRSDGDRSQNFESDAGCRHFWYSTDICIVLLRWKVNGAVGRHTC